MKIISKIEIHPFCYVVALICIFIGYFRDFLTFTLIIFVHELGHSFMAYILKWNINKILILPVGGMTKFSECLNKPIIEEFLIAISGPLLQIIFYILFKNKLNLFYYHYLILIFNLIPVYPLDGAKILNLFLNKITSFKTSYLIGIYLSYVLIILLLSYFIINKSYLIICTFIILLIQLYKEYNNINFVFNKFCLERYLNDYKFKKQKIILGNKLVKMKRDYTHIFFINNKYYREKVILANLFDKT